MGCIRNLLNNCLLFFTPNKFKGINHFTLNLLHTYVKKFNLQTFNYMFPAN